MAQRVRPRRILTGHGLAGTFRYLLTLLRQRPDTFQRRDIDGCPLNRWPHNRDQVGMHANQAGQTVPTRHDRFS